MTSLPRALRAAPLCLLAVIQACATAPVPRPGGYYQDDGPGVGPVDVAAIPDPVPRAEPLARSGNQPYTIFGVTYQPMASARGYRERGIASWYGRKFHGRLTSSGEPYDMYAMTAAHKTLPLPSYARVRNLENGRSVIVRVNDRGPFLHNRLIDLSYAAAAKLGIADAGTGIVEVEAIDTEEPPTLDRRPPPFEVIPTARAAPADPPRLFVQVGAFAQWDNAVSLRARLEQAAFRPIVIHRAGDASRVQLYRVRIGPVASVEEADRLAARLAEHGMANALIVVE